MSKELMEIVLPRLAQRLNRQLVGWADYFCLGAVNAAYRSVMSYTCQRLRQWLGSKYHVPGSRRLRYSEPYLREHLGLVWLPARLRRFS